MALLLGLAGGLSGCGGSAKPSTMPSTSGSSTPSASPSGPVEPVLPEAAKANTKAGAVAFVKHYVELINYAQATGDVDGLRAASDPACETCGDIASSIAELYGKGGQLVGGQRSMLRDEVDRGLQSWVVLTRIKSTPQQLEEPGQEVRNFPGGEKSEEFRVSRTGDAWKVIRWTRVD